MRRNIVIIPDKLVAASVFASVRRRCKNRIPSSSPSGALMAFRKSAKGKPKIPNALMRCLKTAFDNACFHIVLSGWV